MKTVKVPASANEENNIPRKRKNKERKKRKVIPALSEDVAGRKSVLEDAAKVEKLRAAFVINCNVKQACLNARVGYSTLRDHIKNKTKIVWEKEEYEIGDLIDVWRSNVGMIAKQKIYNTIKDEKTGTQDAWRHLERTESEEYGLEPGQGSVDSAMIPIDLGSVAREKLKKYVKARTK